MAKISAGILMFRMDYSDPDKPQFRFFLAHAGGPFWVNKEGDGCWSIPKGELDPEGQENIHDAAQREFTEETGIILPYNSVLLYLGYITQSNGKIVHCWGYWNKSDNENIQITSNTCTIHWPPGAETTITIPEIDKAQYFSLEEARKLINQRQLPFIERLLRLFMYDRMSSCSASQNTANSS